MSLPMVEAPKYTVTLPSSGEKIMFRPFLVREQKQLMVAVNGDAEQQMLAVEDIIKACTFDAVNPKKLSSSDAEFLFLQIRARSIGETIDLSLTCGECNHVQSGVLDLTLVNVTKPEGHAASVELSNGVILKLRDPGMQQMDEVRRDTNPDTVIKLIASCIQNIWQGDEMFSADEYSLAELIDFVESLLPVDLDKLQEFFESLPVLRHEINFECKQCGAKNTAVLEGLQSFFV